VHTRTSSDFWGNQGLVRFVVYAGALTAPILAFAAVGVGDRFGSLTTGAHYGFAFLATVALALAMVPPRGLPRIARASVATAAFHLLILGYGVSLWVAHQPINVYEAQVYLAVISSVPLTAVFSTIAGLVAVAAVADLVRAHRRRGPRWTRHLSSAALIHMLLLGLWSPLIALASGPYASATRLAQGALLPTTLGTIGIFYLSHRLQGRLNWKSLSTAVLIGAPIIAVAVLAGDAYQLNHYANLLAFVIIDATLVLAALLANAICQWWSLHLVRTDLRAPAPWVQEGIALADSGVIAWCEDHGPLLGVRYHVRKFRLRTAAGVLEVPGGRLVAPLPGSATTLSPGERMVMIPAGARVQVTGFVDGATEGPYRSADRPVPGSRGLVIMAKNERELRSGRELLMTLWRPATLYLVVSIAAWLPALAAAISSPLD
jgi:hypothetical protein